MLQRFSDGLRSSKLLAGVIILIIVVPFALWGIGSYVRGGGDTFAAVVNDTEISPRDLERAYVEQRNRLQEMFGGRLPAQFADGQAIRQQALDSLINRELLFQEARDRGYVISDATLAETLLQVDAFKQDGRFDQQRYETQLRSQGMSPSEFEHSTKSSLVINQMRRALAASDFVLAKESLQIQALRQQTRSLQYIELPLSTVRDDVEVSDAEVREYYDANSDQFTKLARVKVEYIELDEASLAEQADVSEEDITQYYESRSSQYSTVEEREAAHILLTLPSDATDAQVDEKRSEIEKLRQTIVDGAGFDEIARQHSEDPGSATEGGNLGSVAPGLMVKEFEDALFAMGDVGDVSDPVRTDFGWHLIKLLGMVPSHQQTLAEVRDEIVQDLQQQRAENLFFDRAELLGNASYESPDSLQPAADATGLPVQTTDWFDMTSTDGLASFASFRAAALNPNTINERRNSDLIELGSNHVIVFRISDHEPSVPKPFDEVAAEVREVLVVRKASETLTEKSQAVLEALREGGDAATLAKENGVDLIDAGSLTRNDTKVERNLIETAFGLPKPTADKPSYGSTVLTNGNRVVVVLNSVDTPTGQSNADPKFEESVERARGNRTFEAWLRNLRDNASIRVANNALQ